MFKVNNKDTKTTLSLLLTLNKFHTFLYCFYCYFEQVNKQLSMEKRRFVAYLPCLYFYYFCFLLIEAEDLIFEDERPHTLASLLKLFFRQLPKPVVCTEFYEDFLRCTGLSLYLYVFFEN